MLLGSLAGLEPGLVRGQGGGSVAGIQEYFIPGTQAQMLEMFNDILNDISSTLCVSDQANVCISTATPDWEDLIEVRVSLVAYADKSVVLIDRAANGYVSAGDYDPSHFDGLFNLNKGEVLIFDQLGSDQLRGGDRLVSIGGPIFVVRAGWPSYIGSSVGGIAGPGQVLAGYWELYPSSAWGREYGAPMGEDGTPGLHIDDRTTKIVVQAQADNTLIQRNGNPLTSLNRGQSFLVEGVLVGDKLTANQPFSASLVASGRQNVDMRFFNLTPPALVDHDYILPLSSMHIGDVTEFSFREDFVRLYIYAYDATTYSVYQGQSVIASATLSAGETAVHPIFATIEYETGQPLAGRLRVSAEPGARLQVLAAVNSGGSSWDWGFPVVGSKYLIDDYYLPWSPATGPNYPNGTYLGLGHPVLVSPVENNTTIQIDWDNDSNPDHSVTLNQEQWIALVDEQDKDNTGAHLTGSGPFTVVWGQDLLTDSSDGYDLGYTILPQSSEFFAEGENLLALSKAVTPDLALPGETFEVTLQLRAGQFAVDNVAMTDLLPSSDFSYRPNSSLIHYPTGQVINLEPLLNGQELVWDIKAPQDPTQEYTLPARQGLTLTFQMAVAFPYSATVFPDTQINNAVGFGQWQDFEFQPTAFDFLTIIDEPALTIVKEADPESANAFIFTSTVPGQPTFSLIDDGDPQHNRRSFTGLAEGAYVIAEDPAAWPDELWALIGADCVDQIGNPASVELDLENHQVTIFLQSSQHVTCTFFNERANYLAEDEIEGNKPIYLPLILK
jgi:hypothetical protein